LVVHDTWCVTMSYSSVGFSAKLHKSLSRFRISHSRMGLSINRTVIRPIGSIIDHKIFLPKGGHSEVVY